MGNSILARFWVTMVGLVVILFLLSGLLLDKMLERTYYDQRAAEMQRQGEYLAKLVETEQVDAVLSQKLEVAAQLSKVAILVANNEGIIWKSSRVSAQRRFPRLDSEETQQMMADKPVIRRGFNRRLGTTAISVIVPFSKNGQVDGAVALYAPLSGLQAFVVKVRVLLAWEMLGAILLVSIGAFFLARSMVKPIMTLAEAAKGMALGKYDVSVPETRQDELGILEKAFNRMAQAVERSIKMQKDFVANVSHELRTPLAIIKGYAESLLDGVTDDEREKNKHLEIIVDEADRLGRLSTELLDLAQLDAGILRIYKEDIPLSSFIARIFSKFQHEADEKRVTLVNTVSEDFKVHADHERLSQVFFNLVSNALRFTPGDGKIEITATAYSGGVQISVQDNGQGMDPEELSFIWQRFYTGDHSRQRSSGRGLGLSISKTIIEAHGGTIEATSTRGQGATFIVRLPA
ncbi:MAG TPA: HAMP domain-containing sensor histidine kinase [Negativicutes bacterium]|nr:HAMP domain-containing sensor histidine kinase [Negativicutes bacterium]